MSITVPGDKKDARISFAIPKGAAISLGTVVAPFDGIKHALSQIPLKRPQRTKPFPLISNEALKKLAETHRPPAEWFDGEETQPF